MASMQMTSMRSDSSRSEDDREGNRLKRSIESLNKRVDWIPMGWQTLFMELRMALQNADCEKRKDVVIEGAYEEDGLLYVDASSPEPVVQGLLRKARTRAMNTCMDCGGVGKPREFEWQRLTLCGRCAGRVRVHLETWRLLSLDRCGTIDLRRELLLSPQAALVRVAWEASAGRPATEIGSARETEIRAWLEKLLDFTDRAAP